MFGRTKSIYRSVCFFVCLTHAQFTMSALTEYMCKTRQPTCWYLHTCAVCTTHYGNQAQQLGAGIRREIRPRWHGSFNEVLSRKSRSEAAFILCHFSNNVCRHVRMCACVCVCVPAHLFVCRETGVFSHFSPHPRPSLRARASACLHGFRLPMRFTAQFKKPAA